MEVGLACDGALFGGLIGAAFERSERFSFHPGNVGFWAGAALLPLTFPTGVYISTTIGHTHPVLSDAAHVANWTTVNALVWGMSCLVGPLTFNEALACWGILSGYGALEKGESLLLRKNVSHLRAVKYLTGTTKIAALIALTIILTQQGFMHYEEGVVFAVGTVFTAFVITVIKAGVVLIEADPSRQSEILDQR